jgi:hypothetical protein
MSSSYHLCKERPFIYGEEIHPHLRIDCIIQFIQAMRPLLFPEHQHAVEDRLQEVVAGIVTFHIETAVFPVCEVVIRIASFQSRGLEVAERDDSEGGSAFSV